MFAVSGHYRLQTHSECQFLTLGGHRKKIYIYTLLNHSSLTAYINIHTHTHTHIYIHTYTHMCASMCIIPVGIRNLAWCEDWRFNFGTGPVLTLITRGTDRGGNWLPGVCGCVRPRGPSESHVSCRTRTPPEAWTGKGRLKLHIAVVCIHLSGKGAV